MKKTIIVLSVLLLVVSFVSAAEQKGVGEPEGVGQEQNTQIQTQQQIQNEGESGQIMTQEKSRVKVQNTEELKENIQQKVQEMNQEIQSFKGKQAEVYQNQNKVRLAVHSLLAMEDLVGGIGRQVSGIAREFDNSVQATIIAEEKIQNRNQIVKFFFGGDEESVGLIEQEVNQNREKIQQLKQLKEGCECDEEIKEMFQEQIQSMEQEQNRLQQLAQGEKQYKGLFGWLFGWLR